MIIDGHTRVCGVIGCPVEHTMSPAIHNALAGRLSHNLVYVPFHVNPGEVAAAVKGAYALNILGINVTVPHKKEVMEGLVGIDALAEKIGAVNTLVRTEEGYKGYNTDMPGLYRAMCSEGIKLEGQEVILLGAGGAARAVAFLCAEKNVSKVYMLNRSVEKVRMIAEEVREKTGKDCIYPMALSDYPQIPARKPSGTKSSETKYLAIQATSVGLFPDVNRAVIEDEAFYEKIHTGYDLIYKPSTTRFMEKVRAHGGKAFHGLKMLLYQGIIAYELWNDVTVSEQLAGEVYEILKEKMGIEDEG